MPFLVVTTPADDGQLLTIEEMRVAAGLAGDDDSRDEELEAIGISVAADICSECNVAIGQGAEPTLLQETLTETFEFVRSPTLRLSRRHEVEIASITIDDEAADAESYRVDPEAGIVSRKASADERGWIGTEVVVVYKAGFTEVPASLRQEALDRFTAQLTAEERDPYIKGETVDIPGVESRRVDYWAGDLPGTSSNGGASQLSPALKRFLNVVVA